MPVATKKRPPMELEPGEGSAHENAESASEEVREGSEPDDTPKGRTNRKRSAKGVKSTKAPMDGDCGCGGGKAKKCTCDGGCGGYAKKMDRSDALTPQEYLAACDLGIQGRSRSYIRARLDAAERLDLKCGNGSISQGEKCHKGAATQMQGRSRITLTGRETGLLSRERIKREGYYGARLGGNPFGRRSQAKRYGAVNAGLGAVAGGVVGALVGGKKGAALGAALGGAYGAAGGAAGGAISAQVNRVTSRAANRSLQRERFEKPIAEAYRNKRARLKASGASGQQIREHDINTAMRLAKGYDRIQKSTKGRYGADSVYAAGFAPELDQLAI
jgi:hypothetical protein